MTLKCQAEAASADGEVAVSSPEDLASIADPRGCPKNGLPKQANSIILEEDSISDLIARDEKSLTGFKVSKDRLTLCQGDDTGSFKIKPVLVYCSESLKNDAKSNLPVFYEQKNKAQMMFLFVTMFNQFFKDLWRPWFVKL